MTPLIITFVEKVYLVEVTTSFHVWNPRPQGVTSQDVQKNMSLVWLTVSKRLDFVKFNQIALIKILIKKGNIAQSRAREETRQSET